MSQSPDFTDVGDYLQTEVVEIVVNAEALRGYLAAENLAIIELHRRLRTAGRRRLSFSELRDQRMDLFNGTIALKFEAVSVPDDPPPTDAQ